MEYSYELFKTTRANDTKSKYRFVLSGAFYDVYTDDDKVYHMDVSMEKSLRERLRFYKHSILKGPSYLVFQKRVGLTMADPRSFDCLYQVLGLPIDVYKRTMPDGTVRLADCDHVLDAIVFEKGLFFGYGKISLQSKRPELLGENRYCNIGLLNSLVENGIFFPNVERLVSSLKVPFPIYPVYLDRERLPSAFLREESASKLILDFGNFDTDFSYSDLRAFKSWIDGRSVEELFQLAFGLDNADRVQPAAVIDVLQDYFRALMRPVVDAFFQFHYGSPLFQNPTVLDRDTKMFPLAYRHFAVGRCFVMYAKSTMVLSLDPDGKRRIEEQVGPYAFSKADEKGLALAYDCVKAALRKAGKDLYPEIFLRWMGLPYEAFERCAYFDFVNRDGAAFAKLFDFVEFDFFAYDVASFCLKDGGEMELVDTSDARGMPYLLPRLGLFLIFEDNLPGEISYTLGYDSQAYRYLPLSKENGSFVDSAFPVLQKLYPELRDSSLQQLGFRKDKDGDYPEIQAFFAAVTAGVTSYEYLRRQNPDDPHFEDKQTVLYALLLFYFRLTIPELMAYYSPNRKRGSILFNGEPERLIDKTGEKESTYFFSAYGIYAKNGERPIFPIEDKTLLESTERLFEDTIAKEKGLFYGAGSIFTFLQRAYLDKSVGGTKAVFVTGLSRYEKDALAPLGDKKIVDRLTFSKDIRFFDDEANEEAIKADPNLSSYWIRRKNLLAGNYVVAEGYAPFGILVVDKERTMPPFLKDYLQADYAKLGLFELGFREMKPVDTLQKLVSRKNFDKTVLSLIDGRRQTTELQKVVDYTMKVNSALYQIETAQERSEHNGYRYVGAFYDPDVDLLVFPGPLFDAYAEKDDPETIFLSEKDRPVLDNLSRAMRIQENVENTIGQPGFEYLRATLMGAPFVLRPLFLRKDFKKKLAFRPLARESVERSYFDFATVFKTRNDPFLSSVLFNRAAREGVVLFEPQDLVHGSQFEPAALERDVDAAFERIANVPLFVLPRRTGLAKVFFSPDEALFESLVTAFVYTYSATALSSEFLFYVKEMLEYLHDKEKDFVAQLLQLAHLYEKDYAFSYLDERLRGFGIKEMKREFSRDMCDAFLVFFAFFVAQEYFKRLWKRILVEEF